MGDHEKIAKNKAELREIKEKRRLAKEPDKKKIEESHNKWKDTHEKNAKVIKADSSKWDVDHEKIRKNKAELQAIKEKKRASKLAAENELKLRNAKKKKRIKNFIMRMNKNQKKLQQIARIGTMTGKKSINNVQRLRPSKKRNECQNWQKKMN